MIRRVPSRVLVALAIAATGLTTAACGGGTDVNCDEVKVISVDVSGDSVTPAGDRIDVCVNQPIDVDITSDVDGIMHIHSSPEQTKDFTAGDNDPIELQFDRAGVVEIELHEPFEGPVVSLEVR